MAVDSIPDDDFLVVEDLDLGDENELRRVVAEVESMVSPPGRGLRVSVLTAEQWQTVLQRLFRSHLSRGLEHHINTLRDPRESQHLLVSPSAVQGINEGQRNIYQDVVYRALKCIDTPLAPALRQGTDDILAEAVSKKISVPLYCRNYPKEREFVLAVAEILARQYGHEPLDWVIELRRSPDRVLMALSKSSWAKHSPMDPKEAVRHMLYPHFSIDDEITFEMARSIVQYNEERKNV